MTDKIGICHVVEAYEGGIRRHLHDILLNLPASRYEQSVAISLSRRSDAVEEIKSLGFRVIELPMARRISPVRDLRSLTKLVQHLKASTVQIVHGHSSKAGIIGRIAGRLAGKKTVYTPNGWAFGPFMSRRKSWVYARIERMALAWTDLLINVSDSERRLALEYGIRSESQLVIPNAVQMPDVELTRPCMHGASDLTLGFLGRLAEQKNPFFLLDIMEALRAEPVRLVIAGDGPMRESLTAGFYTRGLLHKVEFLGMVSGPEQVMPRTDLFLLPSLWEGMPYVLLEAHAFGVPCLASRVVGNTDVVDHGVTGFLLDPQDPAAWADQIKQMSRDRQLVQAMGERAREHAARHFSIEGMVDRLTRAYEELVRT